MNKPGEITCDDMRRLRDEAPIYGPEGPGHFHNDLGGFLEAIVASTEAQDARMEDPDHRAAVKAAANNHGRKS